MKIKILLVPVVLMTALFFYGCAWFGKADQDKPAQQLVQEGVEAYDSGNYKDALDAFGQLKDWYPFSKYAILAELKIADAHYHLEEYPEAVAAYEEFERLHPRNEAAPYVIYQIGRCYFEQIDTIDRDQGAAQKALETFRRLMRQYPHDPYAQRASDHIVRCLQNLAGHEFHIGRFYFKQKQYAAALHRFLTVIHQYPDVGYHDLALQYIAACESYKPTDHRIAN
ncbi:MAG: outer membrane protein assembly factor BamD [Desulfobacteraceae bacterium]|nr:MAG: outer membrane protein assembly factor BamD [Desulfobacteraceae bacterium]